MNRIHTHRTGREKVGPLSIYALSLRVADSGNEGTELAKQISDKIKTTNLPTTNRLFDHSRKPNASSKLDTTDVVDCAGALLPPGGQENVVVSTDDRVGDR